MLELLPPLRGSDYFLRLSPRLTPWATVIPPTTSARHSSLVTHHCSRTFALSAVGVVAGAADLHHVNLGRVLTLLATVLAALRRLAAAGFARALVLSLLVCHLVPPCCKRRGRGCPLCPKFHPAAPSRGRAKAINLHVPEQQKVCQQGGRMKAEG